VLATCFLLLNACRFCSPASLPFSLPVRGSCGGSALPPIRMIFKELKCCFTDLFSYVIGSFGLALFFSGMPRSGRVCRAC